MKALGLGFFLLLLSVAPAFAQEELKIETVTPTPEPEVSYTLPYPGILPDNPLYVLKASRDRIISFFISDPVKKAEFDLLQADERLQAGLFLLHKEKPDVALSISTISKGQNYLHEAIQGTEELKKKEKEGSVPSVGDLPMKLLTAAKKHRELLQKESAKGKQDEQQAFMLLVTRSDEYVKRAERLAGEKK